MIPGVLSSSNKSGRYMFLAVSVIGKGLHGKVTEEKSAIPVPERTNMIAYKQLDNISLDGQLV